ncbi:MAG: transglycosylase domain-containing protein [Bacilli bacterium]|nr:transglycosylase domain-containing protein [Bacilli bacterium]
MKKKIIKTISFCFLGFFILFVLFNMIGFLYAFITPKLDIRNANAFSVFDNQGKLVFQGNGNDSWVSLNNCNDNIINATISVEDKNFYKHFGFDFLRITKAMIINLSSRSIKQGASSITQQYAKNLFLDFEQSWKRKWKEMWLTYELEAHYTKNEILEGYLNTINYGHGMYGISNASKYYFGKDVKDLSLSEASILAGIPNSPSDYSPLDNYELSKERQLVVLTRMYKNGYITKEEMNEAYNKNLEFKSSDFGNSLSSLLYYNDAVMAELNSIDSIPKSYLDTGNIKIYTSLDIEAQNSLELGLEKNAVNQKVETSKVMMNPKDGSIIALIGGINYGNSQFNRAINSYRQPGSTVKPFLYYRALENGFTASTTFFSKKTTFYFDNKQTYSPKNYGGIYANKEISLAAAIAYSDNIFAVKTHLFLGEEELYDVLKKVGVTSKIEKSPSLALGTYEMSMYELTAAYATLANGGKKVNPHLITKVVDKEGNILYEYNTLKDEYVLDSDITYLISELLTGTYDVNLVDYTYPTCFSMTSSITHKYAIKTGSTDTDSWVVGYTPEVVFASWAGYDDSSIIPTEVIAGNKSSWVTSMEAFFKEKDATWYKTPKDIVGVLVNPITGNPVTRNKENKKILYYLKGTEPLKIKK